MDIIESEPTWPIRSLDFDRGAQDYLSLTDANWSHSLSKLALFGAFQRKNTTSTTLCIMAKWSATATAQEFKLEINSSDRLTLDVRRQVNTIPITFNTDSVEWTTTYQDTDWHWFYVTMDPTFLTGSGRYKMYLPDGSTDSVNSSSFGSGQGSIQNGNGDFRIGARNPNLYWNGQLYIPSVFDTTLPAHTDIFDTTQEWPKDFRTNANLITYADGLDFDPTHNLIGTDFTNNNTVTATNTSIPLV
jgi:hypothetical protein